MADLIDFPRRLVAPLLDRHSVDDWGRDQHLVSLLAPFTRLRWNVGVSGVHHLPTKGGALLVCNARSNALTPVYASLAIAEATGRPVRFVGRPDTGPLGAFMRRIGALLEHPDDIRTALRHHELVMLGTAHTGSTREAGTVSHELVAAAVLEHCPVVPVACTSSNLGRTARADIGAPVRPTRTRRGPLAEVELADAVQRHLQRHLDGFGGVRTGVAAIDRLAEG